MGMQQSQLLMHKLIERSAIVAPNEEVVTATEGGVRRQTYRETRARSHQLAHALEREDELLQRQEAARRGVAAEGESGPTPDDGDEMASAVNLQSQQVASGARVLLPGDVGILV